MSASGESRFNANSIFDKASQLMMKPTVSRTFNDFQDARCREGRRSGGVGRPMGV